MIKILVNFYFWNSLYNAIFRKILSVKYLSVIALFLGLIVSSPVAYFIPSIRLFYQKQRKL